MGKSPRYKLKLFINAGSAQCAIALKTLQHLCDVELAGDCELSIFDVLEHPAETELAGVLVTPTVVIEQPPPVRKLFGDLSNPQKVLAGLQVATSSGR